MCEKPAQTDEEKAAEAADKNLERIHKYAWDWFSYHAGQRTSMFNYSLAAAGLLAAGYGMVLDKSLRVAGVIGFLGALVMLCFMILDFRNRRLVEYGESVLRYAEATLFRDGINGKVEAALEEFRQMPAGILLEDRLETRGLSTQGRPTGFVAHAKAVVAGLRAGGHKGFLPLVELVVFVVFFGGGVVPLFFPELLASKDADPVTARALDNAADTIGTALRSFGADPPATDTPTPAPPAAAPETAPRLQQ